MFLKPIANFAQHLGATAALQDFAGKAEQLAVAALDLASQSQVFDQIIRGTLGPMIPAPLTRLLSRVGIDTSIQDENHEFKKGQNVRYLGIESYRDVQMHNWSREVHFRPEIVFFPKTREDIITIVKDANSRNKRISIIGKGHSWNPLMAGSDYLISTVDMDRIIKIDTENNLVTVEAGATIAQVDEVLAPFGLSVPFNIVGTRNITYGGLMATGSHGSGRTCVPMSDLMVEVEMIRPDGRIETFSDATHGKDVMDALRLNLGLFGVMHKITFKVEPSFNVEVTDQNVPVQELFDRLPQLLARHQTVEVLWFPFTDNVTVKAWNRTYKPKSEISLTDHLWARLKRKAAYVIFDKYVSRQLVKDPASTPSLLRRFSPLVFPERTYITDVTSAIHYVDEAVQFPIKETEIALGFEGPNDLTQVKKAWDAMVRTVYANARQGVFTLNIIAHMRFSAGSTAYMSPAYGNKWTAWLDFGSYYRSGGWGELVDQVWRTWRDIPGVKLHWAKEMHRHEGLDLRQMYGRENIEKFLGIRAQFDPKGLFANDFMRGLFGLG